MKPVLALALCAAILPSVPGCKPEPKPVTGDVAKERAARNLAKRLQAACASPVTYDRLKQVAFDEAIRIRNADPVNLETLATTALVRVEQPRVVSRDETLDVTVCSGRLILQVPPGAERAFGGEHQLAADVEYAAQAAADGSGLVYQLKGAEPIIYKLAAFDLKHAGSLPAKPAVVAQAPEAVIRVPPSQPTRTPNEIAPAPSARPEVAVRAPAPAVTPRPRPNPSPKATEAPQRAAAASPSFNCRYGRSASERMVCASDGLAALDRAMASRYYAALDRSDPATRTALRRSRDRFLAFRERCGSEACVAQAYRDRIDEIDDIAGR